MWDLYCTGSIACTRSVPRVVKTMYGTANILPEPSRETQSSGVHKETLSSPGSRRSYPCEPISNGDFKKAGAKRDPRESARAPEFACHAQNKNKIKN